jgi:hypothetical protein
VRQELERQLADTQAVSEDLVELVYTIAEGNAYWYVCIYE